MKVLLLAIAVLASAESASSTIKFSYKTVSKPHVPKKKEAYSPQAWAKRVKEVTYINTSGDINGKRPQPDNAGVVDSSVLERQIVGGEKVNSITQVPWQVHVDSGGTCGGAVIDVNWVITAAHCVCKKNTETLEGNIKLTFGSTIVEGHQRDKLTMDIKKDSIIVHEDYKASTIIHDVALIKLDVPLPLSKNNKKIVAVRLPKSGKNAKDYTNAAVILSGWGKTSDSSESSDFLKLLKTKVISQEKCLEDWSDVEPSNICFQAFAGQSICEGDSGGPMVTLEKDKKYTLLGVTSYGSANSCENQIPGVYVRLSYYLSWISEKTGLKL